MEALVIPFTAATVFTLGGYGIMRAKQHAEIVAFALGIIMLICVLLILTLSVTQLTNRFCAPADSICFPPSGAQVMMAL